MIVNQPKRKMALLKKVRQQLEHRAMWLALLHEEAVRGGLDPETFGRESCRQCGCLQGAQLAQGSTSFKDLKKRLFTKGAQWVFEMKILKCDEDSLDIDFHYCPLVAAWQKMGLSDREIEKLCDTAMCGDRGIASSFGGCLTLGKTIAKGDGVCEIRFGKPPRA